MGEKGRETAGDGCVTQSLWATEAQQCQGPLGGSEGHFPEVRSVAHLSTNPRYVERRSWGREITAWRFQPTMLGAEKPSKPLEKALWSRAAADGGSWTAAGAC